MKISCFSRFHKYSYTLSTYFERCGKESEFTTVITGFDRIGHDQQQWNELSRQKKGKSAKSNIQYVAPGQTDRQIFLKNNINTFPKGLIE